MGLCECRNYEGVVVVVVVGGRVNLVLLERYMVDAPVFVVVPIFVV